MEKRTISGDSFRVLVSDEYSPKKHHGANHFSMAVIRLASCMAAVFVGSARMR
jgi:archaeosine-15-forming tRNA-guanine transglycosylase